MSAVFIQGRGGWKEVEGRGGRVRSARCARGIQLRPSLTRTGSLATEILEKLVLSSASPPSCPRTQLAPPSNFHHTRVSCTTSCCHPCAPLSLHLSPRRQAARERTEGASPSQRHRRPHWSRTKTEFSIPLLRYVKAPHSARPRLRQHTSHAPSTHFYARHHPAGCGESPPAVQLRAKAMPAAPTLGINPSTHANSCRPSPCTNIL